MSAPYRDPDAPMAPPEVLEGPDEASTMSAWLVSVAVFPLASAPWLGWWALALVALSSALVTTFHQVDRRTRRFVLRVEGDAFVVESLIFGSLRVSTRVASLEDDVHWIDPWDDWDPCGINFHPPPWRLLYGNTWSFGPTEEKEGYRLRDVVVAMRDDCDDCEQRRTTAASSTPPSETCTPSTPRRTSPR